MMSLNRNLFKARVRGLQGNFDLSGRAPPAVR